MSLNKIAVEHISKLTPINRYKFFIKRIADFEEMWTIIGTDGEFALSKIDKHTLVSFWSDEPFIKSNLTDSWKKCISFKLSLEDFNNTFFKLVSDNNYLMNIFPVNGKSGFVVNLEEFVRDLNEELEQYE